MQPEEFVDLMRRVRAGNEAAATEFFRRFEPQVRRIVRVRLTDPGLRRAMDESDICQTVFASFLDRHTRGQFELTSADDVIKLLAIMVRNKLVKRADKERAARRDHRRMASKPIDELAVAADADSPSVQVSNKEILEAVYHHFTPEERHLADQRAQGKSWQELADEFGASPEAVRKKLERAFRRLARELNSKDSRDGG